MKVPIARTSLTLQEKQSVLEPLHSGWLVQGPKVKNFEEQWSAFTKADHSIAVTSCTSALHLSLAALEFGPEDEAIVPAFTWVSTANVIEHLGGKVVFCDIKLDTFNIDIELVESKITEKTKVILPVHLFGLSVDMDPIVKLAKKYNLLIVEDAACGFGSMYHGNHVGTFGNVGCFSFHPRKAITTGEGGMVTTSDATLAEKIRRLRDHGAAMTDLQRHNGARPYLLADHPVAGYNQRMTDLQGSLGSAQMDRADDIVFERRRIAQKYDNAFENLDWLKTPLNKIGYEHGYQSYACLFEPEVINENSVSRINVMRNAWMDKLQKDGVSTRPATHAVHMLSYYKEKYGIKPVGFPNAYAADQCSISLPLFHGMKEDEQNFVIDKVLEFEL
ncbi:MAG: DegT/DnrJ/EryC1/StrS family aminotransferase [Candidatus Marinimicrobia bacterium]|nr:DegT/DnrJ/EryC1/StrS family aminotransferase [Candidatus Neomarinimicrobiota bacterium]